MRTELVAELAGSRVRGVVTAAGIYEMAGSDRWVDFTEALDGGDPRVVRRVLTVAIRDTKDLRPLDVAPEVDRLFEQAGVRACHEFAVRLFNDAWGKAETARKNSPAVAAPESPAPTTATHD